MKILFLCVANSARSQMAEGLARAMFGKNVEISSAGSEPQSVNPFAIQAMNKIGIDLSNHSSKPIGDVLTEDIDLVITLCADEVCPIVPINTRKEHWPFDDPAAATGTKTDILHSFETIRDQIRAALILFGEREGLVRNSD